MQNKQTVLAAISAGFLLSAIFVAGNAQATTVKKTPTNKIPKTAAVKQPAMTTRRIDGVVVPYKTANLWPIATMIDNVPAARPQAGLNSASVIYETLAEGGIPRFMAVFAKRDMPKVGPVRSTRPYFVKLAAEYRAALAHAGGSPDGLQTLKDLRLVNLEAIKGSLAKFFFRSRGGADTHDLFTTGQRFTAALQQTSVKAKTPNYPMWKFRSDATLKNRPRGKHGTTINLGAGASFLINFQYDRNVNAYLRSTAGRPHLDANTKKQLLAKNVILQIVPKERVLDRKGRLDIQVTGKGKAVLLQNGASMTVNWRKKNDTARTVFTDSHGKEIRFLRGKTWVVVVPKGHSYKLY